MASRRMDSAQIDKKSLRNLIEDVALIKRLVLSMAENEEHLEVAEDIIREIEAGRKAGRKDFVSHKDVLKEFCK